MTENDPQLPDDIRNALKKSPTYTPPESFYQGVLEKIERKRTAVPWYFGYPMKGLATACVLVMIVLVTRESRRTNPGLFRNAEVADKIAAVKSDASPAPATFGAQNELKGASPKAHAQTARLDEDLANSKEVQGRLDKSISGLVGHPSPFEEEDAKLRMQLAANKDQPERVRSKNVAMAPAAAPMAAVSGTGGSTPTSRAATPYDQQARDTVSGVASQASFGGQRVQEWKGDNSSIGSFRTVDIRSPEEWQKLWLAHTSYIVPPPPAPEVDFGTMMVVGIFDGSKPTVGYFVDIVDIQTISDEIIVTYRETSPPAGQPIAQVVTQPFLLRAIPKSSLPVVFQKAP